ncbi:unnamed protein product [Mucor hiemalis]
MTLNDFALTLSKKSMATGLIPDVKAKVKQMLKDNKTENLSSKDIPASAIIQEEKPFPRLLDRGAATPKQRSHIVFPTAPGGTDTRPRRVARIGTRVGLPGSVVPTESLIEDFVQQTKQEIRTDIY